MKCRIHFANEYGQVVYSSGVLFEWSKEKRDHFECYDSLDEAKSVAKLFVENFPLMSCVIRFGNEEEIVFTADEESLEAAQVMRKKFLKTAWKNKQKRSVYFKLVLGGVFFTVIFLIFDFT